MLFPQKLIGLIGKDTTLTVRSNHKLEIELVGCPKNLTPRTNRVQGQGIIPLTFHTNGLAYLPQVIKLKVTDLETEEKRLIDVPSRAFGEKEFFVCLVQSSNIHYGWNPEPTEQYFRKNDDELVLFKDNSLGKDAFIHAQKLERIFHKYHTPITWLLDDTVALKAADLIKKWHWQYGDDYGLLPRSYFYQNSRNYNIEISAEQTTEIMNVLRDAILDIFTEANFPYYTRVMGVDQWVGSIGTNFVKAARQLGLEGIWGMGYDHLSCDTSMFHRGAPWDVYRPNPENFRVPGFGHPVWLLQWTTRDLLNTSYFTPNGATTFSTDADDIRSNRIHRYQDDYYARLLYEYKKNMAQNDFFVYLVHQEDHDSHIKESNQILENFLDQVHSDNLFATLDEVVSWLNIKYKPEEHPWQLIEMEDPLTCHADLKRESLAGNIPPLFAQHIEWGDGPNPTHIAYYGADAMWITRKPSVIPFIYYHYPSAVTKPFSETGELPLTSVPQLSATQEFWQKGKNQAQLYISFESDRAFENLPWILWNSPYNIPQGQLLIKEEHQGKTRALQTGTALVIILKKISQGNNIFLFQF
jgi:hypothetical protein